MYREKVRSSSPLPQTPLDRSSPPARPRVPAIRRNIPLPLQRRRPQFLARSLFDSRSNHADQPVNVPLGVIQMRRNANVAFAQTDDHIFLPQTLINFRRLLLAPRSKASIQAAPLRI